MTDNTSQRQATNRRVGFSAAVVIGAAIAVIGPWEGLKRETYLDIVGVATVCYGETNPALARPGARYTTEQCQAMLGDSVLKFARKLETCISPGAAMTPNQQAVVLSWAYNVGDAAACRSTLVRKLNAGAPPAEWCRELLRWNRAGGREVRGLTNRRQAEYKICIGEAA